jgi:pectinesterase
MTVSKSHDAEFHSIQDCINAIPVNNPSATTVFIKSGIYKEKLFIEKTSVTLIGDPDGITVITFDDFAKKKFPDGSCYGTFNSYTAFIGGRNFKAENVTFENSAGSGDIVGQAMACYVDADRVSFKNCRFIGCQDTLFTGPLPPEPYSIGGFKGPRENSPRIMTRQYYENCFIRGDIDFIFGSAKAVFNNCTIFSNECGKKINGYIAAPSTPQDERFGYLFLNCNFIGDAGKDSVYLARPWRDHARAVFINCKMGPHIKKEGFHNWDKPETEKKSFFAEYGNSGEGAESDNRVVWAKMLDEKQAAEFSPGNILSGEDGWEPWK